MLNKLKVTFYNENREPFPDFLRGFAIALMIQVHITELLLRSEQVYLFYEKWSYFFGGIPAAPVFIILMGYYQDRSTNSLSKEFFRGLKILLLGLALNVMMNLSLIYKVYYHGLEANIYNYIFGVDILIFAGFSYIFIALIRRLIKKNYVLIALIILVHLISFRSNNISLDTNNLNYVLAIFLRVTDWSYFPLIPWITFPILGVVLNRTDFLNKILSHKFSKIFWFVYSLILLLAFNYGLKSSTNLEEYYKMSFELFISALIFLFGWIKFTYQIFERFTDNLLINYLTWLGNNVTAIYFFQWIIIGNTATYLYKSLNLESCFIILGIVIFSVSICTYLYNLSRA